MAQVRGDAVRGDAKKVAMDYQDKQYDDVERNFQEVLSSLEQEPGMAPFCAEYSKLVRAVQQSHDNERRLARKCAELSSQAVEASAKAQTAQVLGAKDSKTIATLKEEVDRAWAALESSHQKEASAAQTITMLKDEMDELTALVEAGPAADEEAMLAGLLKEKDTLLRERDTQMEQMSALRAESDRLVERVRASESTVGDLERELALAQEQVTSKKGEADREIKRREKLEKELREVKAALKARADEVVSKEEDIAAGEERLRLAESKLHDTKIILDKTDRENTMAHEKITRLKREISEAGATSLQMRADNAAQASHLHSQEEQLRATKVECLKLNSAKDSANARLRLMTQQKMDADRQRDDMKDVLNRMEDAALAMRHAAEVQETKINEMGRERDVLLKLRHKAEGASSAQADLVKMAHQQRMSLEVEISNYRKEDIAQQGVVANLHKQKTQLAADAENAAAELAAAQADCQAKDTIIAGLHAQIEEIDNRGKTHLKAVENMRAERNQAAKVLLDLQQEHEGLRRKHTMQTHQLDQQKGEMDARRAATSKEHTERLKVEKERESISAEATLCKQQLAEAEAALATHKAETKRLGELLHGADQDALKLKRQANCAAADKDSLDTQLIRRGQEATLLYQKIHLQRLALSAGHTAYKERLEELQTLKLHLKNASREVAVLRTSAQSVDALKAEVQHLGRQLQNERAKATALSEELETPLNVHRWRKLEGSDPTTYELIHKVQALQKRLLALLEAVAAKDAALADKQALCGQLKGMLDRRPGPEVAHQLIVSKAEVRDKVKHCQALAAELALSQTECRTHQRDMAGLQDQMQLLKSKYFEMRAREKKENREPSPPKQDEPGAEDSSTRRSRLDKTNSPQHGVSSSRSISSRSQSPDKIAALRATQPAGLDLVVSARSVTA